MTATAEARAAKVFEDQARGIAVNAGALIQPTFEASAPKKAGYGTRGVGAPSGSEASGAGPGDAENPSFDFFLRRARLLLFGSVNQHLSFFLDTDQPNWGKGGSYRSELYLQDAFLTYTFIPELAIDAGLFVVPFTHHTLEGAGSLNALDYHAELIRFPAGRVFRDTGVEFRGVVGEIFHYRLGAFEGVRNYAALEVPVEPVGASYPDVNESGIPRFAGMLRVNVLGAENDFFLKGIYFSTRPIVSLGVGGDYQPKAVLNLEGQPDTYSALSADVFAEIPLSPADEIVAKANVFYYGEGWSRIAGSSALEAGGRGFFAEAGFRHAWFEPVAYVEYLKANSTDLSPVTVRDSEILVLRGGANFWIDQHTFNVKVDGGYRKTKKDVRAALTGNAWDTVAYEDLLGTVQAQVYF